MGHPLLAEPEFATFYFPKLMLLIGAAVRRVTRCTCSSTTVAAEIGAYLYLKSPRHRAARRAVSAGSPSPTAGFMLGHRAHTMYIVAGAVGRPFVLLAFRSSGGTR